MTQKASYLRTFDGFPPGRRPFLITALLVLLILPDLLAFQNPAEATVWTVTNTADKAYNPPEGTLRHAVQNAWNNDIITFASSGMEIQLAEELPISKNITIMGSSTTVRQTAPHHRVFSVASGAFVRMEYLTIAGGKGIQRRCRRGRHRK